MLRINVTSVPVKRLRIGVFTLLGLNLVAAGLVLYPPGGSAEALDQQLVCRRTQFSQGKNTLESTRAHAGAVEKGRQDGDNFINDYFLARRSAYITVLSELGDDARQSRLKERETAFSIEGIEASDTLSMLTVTANYEGTYRDLVDFARAVDRSPLLLMLDSLAAAPQSGSNTLLISMKIHAFVREDGSLDPKTAPKTAPKEVATNDAKAAGGQQ